MSTCLACARDFHDECDQEPCCCNTQQEQKGFQEVEGPRGIRPVTISAGRKEAAKLYPIDKSLPCEWRGLANCGGGLVPIVGCREGFQIARHHGPNKNTTENSRHNIHLICKSCHERWHSANNSIYSEEVYAQLPHKPRVATEAELASVRQTSASKSEAPEDD